MDARKRYMTRKKQNAKNWNWFFSSDTFIIPANMKFELNKMIHSVLKMYWPVRNCYHTRNLPNRAGVLHFRCQMSLTIFTQKRFNLNGGDEAEIDLIPGNRKNYIKWRSIHRNSLNNCVFIIQLYWSLRHKAISWHVNP